MTCPDLSDPTCFLGATLRQTFGVNFSFPIINTSGAFLPENDLWESILSSVETDARLLLVLDSGLAAQWPGLAEAACTRLSMVPGLHVCDEILIIPGGEASKDGLRHVEAVACAAATHEIDRHSYLLVIGGGSVLDAVGLAAAMIHRGVRLIRMPSTVLAQNDAGVGVKNGVNAFGQKNFLGVFQPPFAVINDLSLLATLSETHWRSGIAEAVKVAAIKDADVFDWLATHAGALAARDMDTMRHLVIETARLHVEHTAGSGDPFECGSARPLDFGHWSAHWLEVASKHALSHGEAVSIGIALDSLYAIHSGTLTQDEGERILQCLADAGLPIYDARLAQTDAVGRPAVFAGLELFRQHLGGRLTLTIPNGIGNSREIHVVDEAAMTACVHALRARSE